MAGIPYSDRRLYTKAGSKRKGQKTFTKAERASYKAGYKAGYLHGMRFSRKWGKDWMRNLR